MARAKTYNGEKLYSAAIVLTDRHERRFQDMLTADLKNSDIEREFFVDEFADLPVVGWQEFCARMQDAGQTEWLNKIIRLDEEVLLSTMERRLLEALEGKLLDNGKRAIDKDSLDACVKAIQGLVGRSKILSEQRGAAVANSEIVVRIIESKHDEDVPGGNAEKLAKEGSNGGRTATDF